ncbi:MAG: TlpA family protein disulfide reductase [Porphyromonadaceae bacterium]|nr:TlpA family protein disulfide reductase [Porphyromonadaceae bacterium]
MKYVNFCLVTILSLVLTSGSVKNVVPSIGYYPGEMIPDIVLTDLKGSTNNLSDYKGKKVVVNFWATYDAPSRANNVQLYHYLRSHHADISFLSVAFDENVHVAERTFVLDNLNTTSQFCEVKGTNSEIYHDFKLNRGFRNYLIDENGVIQAMNVSTDDLEFIL